MTMTMAIQKGVSNAFILPTLEVTPSFAPVRLRPRRLSVPDHFSEVQAVFPVPFVVDPLHQQRTIKFH